MRLRIGFPIVLAVLLSLIPTVTQAEAPLELPLTPSYDFQADPFLVSWTFGIEKTSKETATEEKKFSPEEKILARWKEKQSHLWTKLPSGKFVINASAYTAAADECGKNDGITASGLKVAPKRTLACPANYPFGTEIAIEGVGIFRCEDRGGAIKGNHFDIYVSTKKEAFAFGRQHLTAEVVEN